MELPRVGDLRKSGAKQDFIPRQRARKSKILKRLGEHNHSPNSVSVKIKSMMSGLKTTSLSSNDSSRNIIRDLTVELNEMEKPQLPAMSLISRIIRS